MSRSRRGESVAPLLRVGAPAEAPVSRAGGDDTAVVQFTLRLDVVGERLEGMRSRLARYRTPPSELPADRAAAEHARFLRWSALVTEVEQALEHGEDVTCDGRSPLAGRCWGLIVSKRFEEARCPACARSYKAAACEAAEWSLATGRGGWLRIGGSIGGTRLSCPAGHALLVCQTWIA